MNLLLGLTRRFMYKSPWLPPRYPPSPFPLSLMTDPLSTPAGIFTFMRSLTRDLVVPWHEVQRFSGTFPSPSHSLQIREVLICPKIVFLTARISPDPLQVGHVLMLLSGSAPDPLQCLQISGFVISNSFSAPKTASSNVIATDASMSLPRLGPDDRLPDEARPPPPPPPKKLSNMSANPPVSPPKPLKSKPPPPPGNPPPAPPVEPKVSYCWRFCLSDSTS